MKTLKLSTKLQLITGVLIGVAIVSSAIGIAGMRRTNAGLETVYNDRVVPLKQLKTIADDYAVAIIDAANKANAGRTTAEETLKGLNDASARIQKNWKDYMATSLTQEETRLAGEAGQLFVAADAAVERLRIHLTGKSGNLKGALSEFDGPLYDQIDPISGKITELVELQLRVAESEYHAAQKRFANTLWLSIGVLALGVTLGGGWGWAVSRGLSRTLGRIAEELAAGSEETSSASHQVSASSQSLAESASEQAASLEETSASLEETSSMVKRNAENSITAKTLAEQTREAADGGAEEMREMTAAMGAIKAASNDVTKILKNIDEIAFQTNILALNAAVEAARAGDAGMGFAVVADEVRNLAQRCATAAKETAVKIEDSVQKSERGAEICARVGQSLRVIQTKAQQMDSVVAEIASASREQAEGVSQINLAVTQMDKGTQNNAATAEECAAASEELSAQAEVLKGTVLALQKIVGTASAPAAPTPSSPRAHQPTRTPKTAARKPANVADDLDFTMPEPTGSRNAPSGFQDF